MNGGSQSEATWASSVSHSGLGHVFEPRPASLELMTVVTYFGLAKRHAGGGPEAAHGLN